MKRIYTLLAISLLIGSLSLSAQRCVPNKLVTQYGFNPDSIPSGDINVPYTATIHAKTPYDTVVVFGGFPVKADIDSIKVLKVIGLPAGFTFSCDNPRCVFVPDSVGCGTFSGTATVGGIFPLGVVVTTYARIGFAVTQRDTIRRFVLRIEPVPANSLNKSSMPKLQTYPNPVQQTLHVFIPQTLANTSITIFSASGSEIIKQSAVAGDNTINTENLAPGIYWVAYGPWRNTLVKNP